MFEPEKKCPVLGIEYNVGSLKGAAEYVKDNAKKLSGRYICFSNVHTTITAQDDEDYAKVLNGAVFTFPDGHPIAREQKKKGCTEAERIAGPDFMEKVFIRTADGKLSHYFYGSTEETLKALNERLKEKYPDINIAGSYSPPFVNKPSKEELDKDIQRINGAGADFIWIGLGAPKQEFWMKEAEGRINGLMLGVGAGFDFHAGTVKRAPEFFRKTGLEWLYRLFQDPGRLFKRYLVTNTRFLWDTKVLRR